MIESIKHNVEVAMEQLEGLEKLRANEHIDYVYEVGEWMFENKLDNVPEDKMVRVGGKLSGVIAFLGTKEVEAREVREIWKEKRDDAYRIVFQEEYSKVNKTTLAREKAKQAVSKADEIITRKDSYYRKIKNIKDAAERMLVFLQSAIKVKNSERFRGEMHDNA